MLEIFYDCSGSIRRTVINHENMKILFQGKYRLKDIGYILHFIVSGYDNNFLQDSEMNYRKYNFFKGRF